ncbi:MAG: thiamine pyrophosphate-dependent dehydrogenase E1 component subunit alpha [Deltaproteobacteria bacterium]|nr:thiamine pyrophosphate-dependent dehydrogenase E1 component subunit alpha [Deltaproteobacteria bacterium]
MLARALASLRPSAIPEDPSLGLVRVLREDGRTDPGLDPFLPSESLLAMYKQMLRIRMVDTRMLGMQRQGRVGFYGECKGEEATPIATAFAVRKEDWIFPALRQGSIMLARGFPLDRWLAQIFGNALDVQKGRQMPSHMSSRSVRQVSWSSCIGTQIPQAVGAAMAAKLRGEPIVTVGFMGDGATSEPDFHCAMNFAAVYRAPCVLVCQNNQFAISVRPKMQTASQTYAVKAKAYGMPGVRVDGNDVLAVYKVVRDAAERARDGGGPTFVESVTFRMGAHSSSDDPSRYRTQEEVDDWARRDPVERYRSYLRDNALLDDAAEEALEREITEEISAAIARVEPAPPPERDSLFDDVYAELPWHLEEQRDAARELPPHPSQHQGH